MSAVFKRAYDRYCKQYEMNSDSQTMRIVAAYQSIIVVTLSASHA